MWLFLHHMVLSLLGPNFPRLNLLPISSISCRIFFLLKKVVLTISVLIRHVRLCRLQSIMGLWTHGRWPAALLLIPITTLIIMHVIILSLLSILAIKVDTTSFLIFELSLLSLTLNYLYYHDNILIFDITSIFFQTSLLSTTTLSLLIFSYAFWNLFKVNTLTVAELVLTLIL